MERVGLFALGAAVALAFDEDGLSVMQETIQQSGRREENAESGRKIGTLIDPKSPRSNR